MTDRSAWTAALGVLLAATACGGSVGSPPGSRPSALDGAALAFDPHLHAVVAVGGAVRPGAATVAVRAWEHDRWTVLALDGSPRSRTSPLVTTDPATGGIVLVGGQAGGTSTMSCPPDPAATPALCTGVAIPVRMLSDVWALRGHMWSRLSAGGVPPEQGQLVAADPASGTVVLAGRTRAEFAGATPGTWRWTAHGWSLVTPTAPEPAASMAADPLTGRMLAYGGQAAYTPAPGMGAASTPGYSRTWQLTRHGWQELHPPTAPDRAPGALTLAPDGRRLLLVTSTGRAWTWTGVDWQRYRTTNPDGPPPSWHSATISAATDTGTGQVVVLVSGGARGTTTWTLADHVWRQARMTP